MQPKIIIYVFRLFFDTQKSYNRLKDFRRPLIHYRSTPEYPRKIAQLYFDRNSKIGEIQFSQRELVSYSG